MARRLADSIWLRPEPKGRQPGLSRSQIASAALAIADAEGFEQVTMRRVAARLRAGTMTLYHYVRTKDDLVALMDDALMAQVLVPSAELSKAWREAISAIARRTRAVFSQHSWALVSMHLAPPGPHAMEHFERSMAEKQSRLEILQQLNEEGEGLAKGSQAVLKGLDDPERVDEHHQHGRDGDRGEGRQQRAQGRLRLLRRPSWPAGSASAA